MKQKIKTAKAVVKDVDKSEGVCGTTRKNIIHHIVTTYGLPKACVKEKMHIALKKGINCGLLSYRKGHYSVIINNEAKIIDENKKEDSKKYANVTKVKKLENCRTLRKRPKKST